MQLIINWHLTTHYCLHNATTVLEIYIYVPRNLGIIMCNLEIALCILRIRKLRTNLEIARVQFANINGLTGRERQSWLTEESWELSEMMMPWTGALHSSGISAPIPRRRGREFLRVGELPRSPWCGGLSIHTRHWRWRRSCKSSLRTSLIPLYTMETWRVQLCKLQKLRYLEVAHWRRAISRLARNFWILRMCSAISRLRKFPDCAEHIYPYWN